MERVMIIGCAGSGKTTLANQLGHLLKSEIIYLDQHFWQGGWERELSDDKWKHIVEELTGKPRWVMDGNYGGTQELRFEKADTVIFLDRSTWRCLWRVLRRTLRYHGQPRPHMPEGCPERFDWEFTHYILRYNLTRRPKILKRLTGFDGTKRVHILRSDHEVQDFLQQVASRVKD
ncbi:MAG: AAA family ATPase [Bacteroidota bacterium]